MSTDERILEALQSSVLILSPSVIAKNIDWSREEVARRLTVLVEYWLVTRVERRYYEIDKAGKQYLLMSWMQATSSRPRSG